MKKAFVQLHLSILLAGFTGILGKLISLGEGLLVWYRMLFSAFFILVLSFFASPIKRLPVKDFLRVVGVGAVVALHWVAFYGSVKYANVSVSLVTFSAVGFFSAFLDPLITKRPLVLVEVLMGIMVMAGIYLIFHFDAGYKLGIVFGVISAFLASMFTILNKTLVSRIDPDNLTFYEMAGGWGFLSLLLPFYDGYFPASGFLPNGNDILWLVVLSLFCTVLAFNLSIRALKKISPFTVNLSFNLEPVYGILLAFLLFKEHRTLGASFYVGMGVIVASVAFQTRLFWKNN